MERDTSASVRPALVPCLVLLAYLAGAAALLVGRHSGATAAWFPAVGVGVIALLVAPRPRWPVTLAALTAAFALANFTAGRDVGVSLLLGLGDSVEVALVGWLVMRFLAGRLRDVNDVWRLFAIATVGAVVGGLLVSLAYAAMIDDSSFRTTLGLVVPSHGASVMLLAPLALLSHRSWHQAWTVRRVELVAQFLTLATATLLTLAPGHLTLGFAPLPVLVWAAVRFSPWVVVIEQIIFAVAISLLTQLGGGPFADIVNTSAAASSTRYAQLYIICVVLIGLPLAIAMEQRERAVARLVTSERIFRRNFTESRIPIALLVLEQDGARLEARFEARFEDCNQATAVLLHRPVEELVGRPVAALLESSDLVDAVAAMGAGEVIGWTGPVGVVGQPRTRLETTLSLLESDEERASFSLHMVDVTEPLELQERLQAERDYTRSVIDTASSMIVVTDVEGTIIVANPALTALTGFTEDELVGRPFWEKLITEDQREEASQIFGDPRQLPREGEAQLRTKDDGRRLVVFSADVYQAHPDSPTSYVISATDVTAAREHAGMVEHLLRSARTIAFVGTDLLGRITLFNTGAEHMLGVAAEAATGRDLVEFIAPEDLERYSHDGGEAAFDGIVEHAADELTPETRDWTWLPSGRAPIKVSMTTNPVTDTFGHVIGYLFVATDITDTRRSQEILVKALRREREVVARLKDLDRAKDDFVSTVSHELRTPMSSIIGSAEMLGEGVLGELLPEQQRMVNVISRNGDRLLALADDLLVLATFDHDSWQDLDSQIDLRVVVRESEHAIAAMLSTRQLEVSYAMPADPVMVNGDATHLERAVTNLLSNAVKFTLDGGSILVSLEADSAHRSAVLNVTDTGLGIAESDLEAVFGRFFRTAVVQRHAIQGSGLGLAIVKAIVESHEGHIDVRSAPDEGTTFTITLPLSRASSRRTENDSDRVSRG
ncbi:ATP-binding protein [Marmoricola sp. URHB0036]|uniref:ATP-binding protein n=1 Tax=Marmoricola sp. URHB0036 TaxID=1298863 RepID=UPI00041A66BC|nr:ATP-binding protein [Marmoricola sp. URHB0036]